MPFAELKTGARLHYESLGQGEPVIVVHGFMGTARHDLGKVIDWLSQDYHVYGPTLRGYGQSTPKPREFPTNFYSIDAEDIVSFMDVAQINKAHLIGYSDGGEVALIAAGIYPDRFISVAVWGAVGYYGPAVRSAAQGMYPATWMDHHTKQLHGIDDADAIVLQWLQSVKRIVDSGGDLSLSNASKISCPLLMMLGRKDALNPEDYGRNFVNRVSDARLVMFDSGHAIHDEKWDEFQKILGGFLKSGNSEGFIKRLSSIFRNIAGSKE